MKCLFGCQYHSNFSRLLGNLTNHCFIFEQSHPKQHFFIIKEDFSCYFNYLCNIPIFEFYTAVYDKRKVGCNTLNDRGNLTIDHRKIMEFYFAISVGTLLNWQTMIRATVSIFEPPCDKTNKIAKTQISLDIRPVWSESSLCAQWVAKDPSFLHADSEDSDQTAQDYLSLRWAHMPFCWFCHEAAHLLNRFFRSSTLIEPCHKKTCLWGLQPGSTQTGLLCHKC